MYLLGFDIGSSSIKVSLLEVSSGKCLASSFQPKQEMEMIAHKPGWAEQEPEAWWRNLKLALSDVLQQTKVNKNDIKSIGISYQMHGLVITDKNQKVLRPSIIWCDSRAVQIGNSAFEALGEEKCLQSLLNSPGNFTAAKLMWVKENEPELFKKIDKIMLPGDYIAMKLSGKINTTSSGLSEGIFWDFQNNSVSELILNYFKFDKDILPEIVPTFSVQGELSKDAADELGLKAGTLIGYRAGDQPNNAFSLNVLNPGEIAATAGTSGVVYGVSDVVKYDPPSRVNSFAHVNHSPGKNRLGILLCVNGTGIMNSWLKRNLGASLDYEEMNHLAGKIPVGSEGVLVLPFGNGAERMLGNKDLGASVYNLNFNIHNKAHLLRAAQEGIVFAFKYGIDIMKNMGISPKVIRAGNANMFLSPIFRDTLAGITGARIELYNTDGAQGAALGAGIGAGIYKSFDEAFKNLNKIKTIDPDPDKKDQLHQAYVLWKEQLEKAMN
ncbi:MAG: carbohydrate kinase [Bacteroidales bacterium]|nr:carbohydrate kinase [Bacteroidales bacterium]